MHADIPSDPDVYYMKFYASPVDYVSTINIDAEDDDDALGLAKAKLIFVPSKAPELRHAKIMWLHQGNRMVACFIKHDDKWCKDSENPALFNSQDVESYSDVHIERDLVKATLRELHLMAGAVPAGLIIDLNKKGKLDATRFMKALQDADDCLKE